MRISLQTEQLSRACLSETTIVLNVPFVPEELCNLLTVVLERLLHPQLTAQVFSDTLLLNSLTREHLAKEKSTPLAYAQRRLAVFELGLQAMLVCADFKREKSNSLFEKIDRERITWDDRVWELLVEAREYTHYPIGFRQP